MGWWWVVDYRVHEGSILILEEGSGLVDEGSRLVVEEGSRLE